MVLPSALHHCATIPIEATTAEYKIMGQQCQDFIEARRYAHSHERLRQNRHRGVSIDHLR